MHSIYVDRCHFERIECGDNDRLARRLKFVECACYDGEGDNFH